MKFRIALSGLSCSHQALCPPAPFCQATADNPSVTAQLEAAKPLVAKIKKDASEMQSYSLVSGPSLGEHLLCKQSNSQAKSLPRLRFGETSVPLAAPILLQDISYQLLVYTCI